MQSDNLELQKDLLVNKDESQKYQDKINVYQSKIKQYEKDKAEIKALAENFEKEEGLNKEHSTIFGLAVIFLQISILLASISALIKQKLIWYLSMGIGCVGLFYFFDGFFLFLK